MHFTTLHHALDAGNTGVLASLQQDRKEMLVAESLKGYNHVQHLLTYRIGQTLWKYVKCTILFNLQASLKW